MKKRLISIAAAVVIMTCSSVSFVPAQTVQAAALTAAEADWQQGWTGKEGGSGFTVSADGSTVVLANEKANNGKFTDGEDSLVYYAAEMPGDKDFVLSARVTIDEYSTLEESSNPHQGSVGIGVLDSLYNKTDDKAYDNGVFVGTYAAKKDEDLTFRGMYRDGKAEKTIGDALSDPIPNAGSGLGSFDVSIAKSGSIYTLTCGENSQTVEMTAFSDSLFPCLYIARNVKATFTNVSLAVDNRVITALEVEGDFQKTYTYGDELNLEGMQVTAVYDDGSREVCDSYAVKGYNPEKAGTQTLELTKGAAAAYIDVTVENLKADKLTLDYTPAKTVYSSGTLFRTEGMQATVHYSNGLTEELGADECTITADGKTITDGTVISGTQPIKAVVKMKPRAGVDSSAVLDTFTITPEDNPITSLQVQPPVKTQYYLGDSLDTTGMTITAVYADGKKEVLKQNEYELTGFSSKTAGDSKITVQTKGGNVFAEFGVTVAERKAEGISITKYPRTTYGIGEEFDPADMVVSINYDSGESEPTADYTVNTDKFSSAEAGKTAVTITTEYGSADLPITIKEMPQAKWRKATFGQSSGYDKPDSAGVTAEKYGTVEGTINVKAWDGCGKITNDHDGMTYYYTEVDGDNDFKLSADIKVNKYLEHNNDDTKRNGQEAFGIMARDVVPLTGADGKVTTKSDNAQKDDEGVAVPLEGNAVFASNIALFGGYSGTGWPSDTSQPIYEKQTKLNRINLLIRDTVTAPDGGGKRIGPFALSSEFPAEGSTYRMTLERVNGGLYARCYDYKTGKIEENVYYDDDLLKAQNAESIYVGFFAARWADIDVSNVSFYETDRSTDQKFESTEKEEKTAEFYFFGDNYVTSDNYSFKLQPLNAKGTVTVSLNGKIIAQDVEIKDEKSFDCTLGKDRANSLVAIFTPSDTESLTSYEPIVIRQKVYNKTDYNAQAEVIYASPDGRFENAGTADSPYDVDTAIGFLADGQTVELAGGTYYRTSEINIPLGKDATAEKPRTVRAAKDQEVIFDFMNTSAGVVLGGKHWNIDGISFTNCAANMKCFHLGGSYCVVSNCKFYGNRDMGLQISRILGSAQPDINTWPSYNTILNCESYNNCDPSMINADGFGAKLTVGYGNVFRNCSSHHNVDDGWDLYTKVNSGAIGAVTLENCVSYRNGWRLNPDGSEASYNSGGNNGFKCGGENVGVQHVLINCTAYGNGNNGITTNSNPMLKLDGVKSFDNQGSNIRLYSDKPEEYNYDVKNTVSYNSGAFDVIGSLNEDTEYTNASETPLLSTGNYFQLKEGEKSVNSAGEEATADMVK